MLYTKILIESCWSKRHTSSDHVQDLQELLLWEINIESNKMNKKILSQIIINNSESQKRIIKNFVIKSLIFTLVSIILDSIILDSIILDSIIIIISSIFITFSFTHYHFYHIFNAKSHFIRITHSVWIRHSSKSLHEYSKSRFTVRRSKSWIQFRITTRRSLVQLWITIRRLIRSRIKSLSISSIQIGRVRGSTYRQKSSYSSIRNSRVRR